MKSIKMTKEQTAVYNSGDDEAVHKLMRDLRKAARAMQDYEGQTVEIYTADGIVADCVV